MADTIGTLAYKLRLDSQEFKAGMIATRAEFAAAKAVARDAATGMDTYALSLRNLQVLREKNLITEAQQSAAARKVTADFHAQEAAVRKLAAAEKERSRLERSEAMGKRISGPMQGAGFQDSSTFAGSAGSSGSSGIGGGFAFGAKAFGGAIVANELLKGASAAKEFIGSSQEIFAMNERNAASFEVFTGSAEKTRVLMEDMKKLAAVSGITISAMASGASSMMSFGVSTEDVTNKMKEMAAISRGDPERFKSMALAYGQVTAAGKLMGQENLQLINSGFAPLAEISRTTGRSMAELRKDMEAGLITTKMVADAFASATSEGGRYNGMLEKIGETTSGAQSKSKAAWDQAKNDVGEALAPLTRFRAEVSEYFAKDVSQLAGLFKAPAAPVEAEKVDPRAAARQRLADTQAREKKALEKMAAEQEAARIASSERLAQTQQSSNMESIKQSTPAAEFEKFNRVIGLLDETTKRTAVEDFEQNRNLGAIYSYLDKSVVAELKKLEAVEQQNKAYAEQKSISEKLKGDAEQLKEKYASSGDKLKQQLVDLEVMRGRGMISDEIYSKARDDAAMTASADGRKNIDQANQLPTAIAQGSQEAYKLMVGNQNRAKTDAKKETEKQTALAKEQVEVAKQSKEILQKLQEQLDFEMVG